MSLKRAAKANFWEIDSELQKCILLNYAYLLVRLVVLMHSSSYYSRVVVIARVCILCIICILCIESSSMP